MPFAPLLYACYVGGAFEVIFVLLLGQPCCLAGGFADAPTLRFVAECLTATITIIGSENFLAVKALGAAFDGLHRVKQPVCEENPDGAKKSKPKKIQPGEEGTKNLSESWKKTHRQVVHF